MPVALFELFSKFFASTPKVPADRAVKDYRDARRGLEIFLKNCASNPKVPPNTAVKESEGWKAGNKKVRNRRKKVVDKPKVQRLVDVNQHMILLVQLPRQSKTAAPRTSPMPPFS